jgi:hypothetical protein
LEKKASRICFSSDFGALSTIINNSELYKFPPLLI